MAKYWVTMVNCQHEIDSQTYENLRSRVRANRTGHYEIERGPSTGYTVAMQHLVSLHIERTQGEDKALREDQASRTVFGPPVGHDEAPKVEKKSCLVDHKCYQKFTKFNADKVRNKDWPDEMVVRVRTTKIGTMQYVPICTSCGKQLPIVKPQTVPRIFGYDTVDDVPAMET